MVIIAWRTLREFWVQHSHRDAEPHLRAWYHEARQADWASPADVKRQYCSASVVRDRIVFNIAGNKYRLVVRIWFRTRTLYVRFVGTHRQYDKIDVRTV